MTAFLKTHSTTAATTRWVIVWAAAFVWAAAPRPMAAATFNVPAGEVPALIQAIEAANATTEADTIILAGGTYTLTALYSSLFNVGLPVIETSITIEGNGAIIERSSAPGTPEFRIIAVSGGGGPEAQLTLNDLTVRNGHVASDSLGGGIALSVGGTVTLTRVTVSGNSAGRGGGIWSDGTLVITRSTISGNNATGVETNDGGGGIYNRRALTISESTVSANSATLNGGGIYSETSLTITQSTLSANVTGRSGGGIFVDAGTVNVTNSTLSGNSASSNGGGILVSSGVVVIVTNSTLAGNSARSGSPSGGGGVAFAGGSTTTLTNTIVANSPSGFDCSELPSLIGPASISALGNNMATDGSCRGFAQVTSGALNLGPLFNNGGPTRTHALLAGSVAIDAGDQAECIAHDIVTDQRGFARDSHCDIGAFEFGAGPRADLLVSQAVDKISVKQGDALTYFITVKNFGPDTAPNVFVTDTLSSGTTFLSVRVNKGTVTAPPVGNTGTVTWSLGNLVNTSSETAQLAVTVLVKGKTTITNTATVSADVVDPNPANNSAAITVSVAAGSAGNGKTK